MWNAPIPGSSLTGAPNKFPWERPPELTDPEEIIQFYLTKLSDPERTEGLMDALDLDIPIKDLTEGILRNGVANGMHSIDASLIVAPVLHEFIKTTADKLGIPYKEGFVDEEEKQQQEKAIRLAKVRNTLSKEKRTAQEQTPQETPIPRDMQESRPSGFVQRRVDDSVGGDL